MEKKCGTRPHSRWHQTLVEMSYCKLVLKRCGSLFRLILVSGHNTKEQKKQAKAIKQASYSCFIESFHALNCMRPAQYRDCLEPRLWQRQAQEVISSRSHHLALGENNWDRTVHFAQNLTRNHKKIQYQENICVRTAWS